MEATFDEEHCAYQKTVEADHARTIFPFLASGEIVSAKLANAVATCAYARAWVARAVRAVVEAPADADDTFPEFTPGGDAPTCAVVQTSSRCIF